MGLQPTSSCFSSFSSFSSFSFLPYLDENQVWEGLDFFFFAIFLLYVRCHCPSGCCKTHILQPILIEVKSIIPRFSILSNAYSFSQWNTNSANQTAPNILTTLLYAIIQDTNYLMEKLQFTSPKLTTFFNSNTKVLIFAINPHKVSIFFNLTNIIPKFPYCPYFLFFIN
jgi:hypothetical protein